MWPDQVLQRATVDAAMDIARGAPDYTALLEALVHQLGADSGACYVTWSLTGPVSMTSIQVAGCPPWTSEIGQLNEQDLQHPGIAQFPNCATVRLSDVTNLRRFWGTPRYQRVHGWLEGYHFPLGAQLYNSPHRLVLLALHRSQRDFTDQPGRTTRSRPTPTDSGVDLSRRVGPRSRRVARALRILRSDPAGERGARPDVKRLDRRSHRTPPRHHRTHRTQAPRARL